MKGITNISLELENLETIKLTGEEFKNFVMENISEQVAQIGGSIVQFLSFGGMCATLDAKANHTYNSFGTPSSQTVFQRLCGETAPIGCVTLEYADGTEAQFYVPDDMVQCFVPDEFGNLDFFVGYSDDDDEDDGCCCGDCED